MKRIFWTENTEIFGDNNIYGIYLPLSSESAGNRWIYDFTDQGRDRNMSASFVIFSNIARKR